MSISFVAADYMQPPNYNGGTSVGMDTTGANLIVINRPRWAPNGDSAPTDSKGNTWSSLTDGAGNSRCRLWYCLNPTVGSGHTFSSNILGGYQSLQIAAFAGVKTVSAFDVENGADETTAASIATGSITPGEDNELVVAGLLYYTNTTVSIDNGFTIAAQVSAVIGSWFGGALAYKIQTTAAAINPTFSWTGSTTTAARIASFKTAAAPSSPSNFKNRIFSSYLRYQQKELFNNFIKNI